MTLDKILKQGLKENEVLAKNHNGLISKYEKIKNNQYKAMESYYPANNIITGKYEIKDYLSGLTYGLNEINIIRDTN